MENITLEAAVCATQLKEAQERLAAMERRYFRLRRYAKRWLVSLHGANVAIDELMRQTAPPQSIEDY